MIVSVRVAVITGVSQATLLVVLALTTAAVLLAHAVTAMLLLFAPWMAMDLLNPLFSVARRQTVPSRLACGPLILHANTPSVSAGAGTPCFHFGLPCDV